MGAKQSHEEDVGEGHPERFYDGCTKVLEGGYTVAEIYFHQAIAEHPGHAFWTQLMAAVVPKASRNGHHEEATEEQRRDSELGLVEGVPNADEAEKETKKTNNTAGAVDEDEVTDIFPRSTDSDSSQETKKQPEIQKGKHENDALHATQRPPASPQHNPSLRSSVAGSLESEADPKLVLPVDRRIVDLQDYARMLTDIGRIYRRKAAASTGDSKEMARRLAMLYSGYTALRLQAMLHLLKNHFARHNVGGDKQGEDMFGLYCKQSMQTQLPPAARFKQGLNVTKSAMSNESRSVGAVSHEGPSESEIHSHDDALCVFWESMQFFWVSNVLLFVSKALRLLGSPDCVTHPATVRAVTDMAMKSFEMVEGQLLHTAEHNAHIYIGELMKDFIAYLGDIGKICTAQKTSPAASGHQSHRSGRTHRGAAANFLRLGTSPSFCDDQLSFLRLARDFKLSTIPLLDVTKLAPVELEVQFLSSQHRATKLNTPQDRNYAWYLFMELDDNVELPDSMPGLSPYLLTRCGVPADAAVRDWSLFTSTGLEEMCLGLFPIAVGTTAILQNQGKNSQARELADTAVQLALNMYGCPTPVSNLVHTRLQEIISTATS